MTVTAFHAVNSGSNPLGDAKKIQGLTRNRKSFFRCGVNLPHTMPHRFEENVHYYKLAYEAVVQPLRLI